MKQELEQRIQALIKELFNTDVGVELTRPDEQFGDYATNVALQLAKQLGKNTREVAEQIAERLREDPSHVAFKIKEINIAGPGFLNLRLSDPALQKLSQQNPAQTLAGKQVVAEYSDPNPFKVLHAGHLYTSVVGDGIASLLEAAGATVHRVNFGGDVGLHVAKTLWAILRELNGTNPEKLQLISEDYRSEWMTKAYIQGTNEYDDSNEGKLDIQIKLDIQTLNKLVYDFWSAEPYSVNWNLKTVVEGQETNIDFKKLKEIYLITRQWSYDYFDAFYARIGSSFDKYYPESETAELGLQTVRENIGKVFQESDGAIIFKGDDHGLHTRVFINSEGLPTYEAKDVGLILAKKRDFNFDKSVVITGNEQAQYMAVVLKAVELFAPELTRATTHLTHGIVKMAGGVKMSSRKGNILRAEDVIDVATEANKSATGKDDEATALAAIKYAFLKNRMGGDIIYDPAESVALEGNSGPYLQYAHARARSILNKSIVPKNPNEFLIDLDSAERSLLRKIGEYTEVVDRAVQELMPHHVCTYLYELAQVFNRFYEHNRVLEDPRQDKRLQLVQSYAETLKNGLELLNIPAPDRM